MGDEDLRNRFRRDFTNQPIGRSRTPRPAPAEPSPNHLPRRPTPSHNQDDPRPVSFDLPAAPRPGRRKKPKRLPLGAALLLLIIVFGGLFWYRSVKSAVPIPISIRSSVNYPLLYPSKLPHGYKINTASVTASKDAVIFEADNSTAQKIVFSQQKRPDAFDFPAFYKQGLGGATAFITPAGEAAIGTSGGHSLGSLATDQSWMLITSPAGHLIPGDLRLILNNIKVVSS